jgi:hypothetical protein
VKNEPVSFCQKKKNKKKLENFGQVTSRCFSIVFSAETYSGFPEASDVIHFDATNEGKFARRMRSSADGAAIRLEELSERNATNIEQSFVCSHSFISVYT